MLQSTDRAFFCCNGKVVSKYDGLVSQAIQSLGLTPIIYGGATLKVKNSNIDKEIRDDLYQSMAIFILLVKEVGAVDPGDLWVIDEIGPAISQGIKCFVYHTPDVSSDELSELKLTTPSIEIENADDLVSKIKDKLSSLLV